MGVHHREPAPRPLVYSSVIYKEIGIGVIIRRLILKVT
jgi:hypothetical protein